MTGISKSVKKDGTIYYRASLTYNRKHISLGSSESPEIAHEMYKVGMSILNDSLHIADYTPSSALPFSKWISLINLRENKVYLKNPIYMHANFFSYYLSPSVVLKFDIDDLFFYSEHRIQERGGHLFCENYGTQVSIRSRYGIHPFSVLGRDYRFRNGDNTDFRYENIEVINRYMGVEKVRIRYQTKWQASVNVRGVMRLGVYDSEEEAAVAFNKALDMLESIGQKKTGLTPNYVEDLPASKYADIYTDLTLSDRFLSYIEEFR